MLQESIKQGQQEIKLLVASSVKFSDFHFLDWTSKKEILHTLLTKHVENV